MPTLAIRLAAFLPFAVAGLLVGAPPEARALTFQADFRATTFQVSAGDTYSDLLAAHLAGSPLASVAMTGFENVSAQVEAGVNGDYSIMLAADLTLAAAGQYVFQVGADWGRGGVAAVIDESTSTVIDELVRTDDIWWNNDWSNPDVFTTVIDLDADTSYTLVWLGFEGCCGGGTTIRFSFEGSPFQPLNETNLDPLVVPEPSTALLLAIGLTAMAIVARNPRSTTATTRRP
jgi:hypothetical protein